MDPHRQGETLYRLPTYTHSAAQGVFLTGLVAAGLCQRDAENPPMLDVNFPPLRKETG